MTEDSVINSEPTSDLFAVYATAKDVACAMAYIHSKDIIHADLQGDALGLVTSSQDPRGYTAKVSSPLTIPCCPPPFLPQSSPHKHTCTLQSGLCSDALLTAEPSLNAAVIMQSRHSFELCCYSCKHIQLVRAAEATH